MTYGNRHQLGNGPKKVSVIIVNWNTRQFLKNCIRSIMSSESLSSFEIVVVDNGSMDGSLDEINDEGKSVILVRNRENLGFAKACNQGADVATGNYLLFLNPDTAVYADTIRTTLDFMESPENSDVGICGVQLIDEFGNVQKSCYVFPSVWALLARSFGLEAVWPSRFGRAMQFDHMHTRDVDQVMGAYFFIRRSQFETAKGFDERFFVYFEELDLSLRLNRMGWRSVFLAQVRAYHKGGGASAQVKAHRLFYSLRSRILYAFKHFGHFAAWAVLLGALVLEPIPRFGRAILRLSKQEIIDTYRGYAMLWRDVPSFLRRALHDS